MPSALIDTNLLVLLVVGTTKKEYISEHKRTNIFTERCYNELLSLLEVFDSIWITSHCLAEVSNLLKYTHEKQAKELLSTLSGICLNYNESHMAKADIFASEFYLRLGVEMSTFT